MILDTELMNSIRNLIGVPDTVLTDEMLADPLLGGAATAYVTGLIGPPGYADRPLSEQAVIRTAVAYRTAASALETGKVRKSLETTSEQFSDQYAVRRTGTDVSTWAAQLRMQADEALAPLRSRSITGMFQIAPGRRGR